MYCAIHFYESMHLCNLDSVSIIGTILRVIVWFAGSCRTTRSSSVEVEAMVGNKQTTAPRKDVKKQSGNVEGETRDGKGSCSMQQGSARSSSVQVDALVDLDRRGKKRGCPCTKVDKHQGHQDSPPQ